MHIAAKFHRKKFRQDLKYAQSLIHKQRFVNNEMQIFLVGGAVRDKLIGYPIRERDWVVVGSNKNEMESLGFRSVGKDFPVFLHPDTNEEYALARQERKTGHGYTGFDFDTSSKVTLEQDLSRRDLTINAIAENDAGELVDPFNGKKDIEHCILRHVSPAFCEDPVRILRIARFAARYHHLGFSVAEDTLTLMQNMTASGEVDHLVAERCWQEFEKTLSEQHPEIFIETLRNCHALKKVLPELDALFGIPQPAKFHPEIDAGKHALLSLAQAVQLSKDKTVRFASLVHDLGKALTPKSAWPQHDAHDKLGIEPLRTLCDRWKVPNQYRDLAALVMKYHPQSHRAYELTANALLKLLTQCDAFRKPDRFHQFLLCCKADSRGRTGKENINYPQANYLATALEITSEISSRNLVEQGLEGKAIGEAIKLARLKALKKLINATPKEVKTSIPY